VDKIFEKMAMGLKCQKNSIYKTNTRGSLKNGFVNVSEHDSNNNWACWYKTQIMTWWKM